MSQEHRHLRDEDRRVIAALFNAGATQSRIAQAIGFSQGAVSKELGRNRWAGSAYQAQLAGELALARRQAKRRRRRAIEGEVAREVERRLRLRHSPEQVSGAMRLQGGGPSRQCIYDYIERDRLQGGDLRALLRIGSRRRRKRRRKPIEGRAPLSERPGAANARLRYGDWEVDLVGSWASRGFLLTAIERRSRVGLIEPLPDKSAASVEQALLRRLGPLFPRSLAFDNGAEFSGHKRISELLGCKAYFCAPYCSWQKGAVENCNGLIRQYVPKGCSIRDLDAEFVRQVERELNERPRKVLGFRSPSQYFKKIARKPAKPPDIT